MRRQAIRLIGAAAICGLMTATPLAAQEAVPAAAKPILEAETSGTLTLSPTGPHRIFLGGWEGFTVINGDTAKVEATIQGGDAAAIALAPDLKSFYVVESYWSRENRGDRIDLVSVYDSTTLKLTHEIKIPGRLIASGRMPFFGLSADGRRAYVFNLEPATSVQVVDLDKKKFLSNIEIPGCGLVLPYGNEGFASLCADGSLATVAVSAAGKGTMKQTKPFFDAEADPVFEESIVDKATGEALFITYSGTVHPVMLAAGPAFGPTWSLNSAVGINPATPDVTLKTWRPGGRRPFAYHRATKTLFALMHEGKHWTFKAAGTEVWAIDTTTKRLKGRFKLPTAGKVVGVSQDAAPQLYVAGEGGWVWIMDPESGKIIRQIDEIERAGMIQVAGF